jgi:KTSC domain
MSAVVAGRRHRHIVVMKPHRGHPGRKRRAPWIAMRPLESSSIAAAGYDTNRKILRLRYIGGTTYDYANVPPDVFAAFLDAPSHGQFVNWRIKPYYAYSRQA